MQLTVRSSGSRWRQVGALVVTVATARCLGACLVPPYSQPIPAQQGLASQQIVVQPGYQGGGTSYGGGSAYRSAEPSFPTAPPVGSAASGGYDGAPPAMPAFSGDRLANPPFMDRIYFGWVPYQPNGLVATVCSSEGEYIEMVVDGRPATIVVDRAMSQRRVARGDHVNRDVNVIPPGAHRGQLQLDAPGEHGAELWCYTEVPGIGLIQVGHTRTILGRISSFCGNVGHIRCGYF